MEVWLLDHLMEQVQLGNADRRLPWTQLRDHCLNDKLSGKSHAAMAFMHEHGLGGAVDMSAANECLRQAAEAGHCASAMRMAQGATGDLDRALWLRAAASNGDVTARYKLGKAYLKGRGVPKDASKAQESFSLCGDFPKALRRTGIWLKDKKDLSAAYAVIRKAAEADDWAACFELYNLLIDPNLNGVTFADRSLALYHLQHSALQGNSQACAHLGFIYLTGKQTLPFHFSKDYALAVYWYSIAAQKKYPRAFYRLGTCYHNGWHVAQSNSEAFKYYKLAADAKDSLGTLQLGRLCLTGMFNALEDGKADLVKDEKQGFVYISAACDLGSAEAFLERGKCFRDGKGTQVDIQKAVESWKTAVEMGCTAAKEALAAHHEAEHKKYSTPASEAPKADDN